MDENNDHAFISFNGGLKVGTTDSGTNVFSGSLAQTISSIAILQTASKSGQQVTFSDSNAISGHPLESLVQLCAMSPEPIPAGSVVLAGAATLAVPVEPGHEYALEVDGLGRVAFRSV